MNRIFKTRITPIATLLTAALLSVGGLASATSTSTMTLGTYDVTLSPVDSTVSGNLSTGASWQTIQIPLADIGGTYPGSLSLSAAGLPAGLSISLAHAAQVGQTLVLNVNVNRSSSNAVPHGVAHVTLLSGTTPLTTFQVDVANLALD